MSTGPLGTLAGAALLCSALAAQDFALRTFGNGNFCNAPCVHRDPFPEAVVARMRNG